MAMFRPLGFALLCSLTLAACAGTAPPRRPLMSPLSEARTFGYSERTVARDQVEVTYLGAARFVSLIRSDRRRDTAEARRQAEELALWRAAQVAMARKAEAFKVLKPAEQRRRGKSRINTMGMAFRHHTVTDTIAIGDMASSAAIRFTQPDQACRLHTRKRRRH